MKNKNEVYVEVRTEKQAKKLKKVFDMFGEEYYDGMGGILEWTKEHKCVYFSNKERMWHGVKYMGYISSHYDKVSIKELRNILATEHLKEGDVCIVSNECLKYIAKIESVDNHDTYPINSTKLVILGETDVAEGKGAFPNFIRYATEEEKALLEPNKELEVGKWYISVSDNIIYYGCDNNSYGLFRSADKWVTSINEMFESIDAFKDAFNKGSWQEATPEEVEQALIKEAKRRYKEGDRVKLMHENVGGYDKNIVKQKDFKYYKSPEQLYLNGNLLVFHDGKWASIIEESPEQKVVKYAESVDWDFDKVVLHMNSKEKTKHIFNKHNSHWELKKAHKEGAEIEYKSLLDGNWYGVQYYEWLNHYEYRIKPLKPNDWVMYYSGDIKKYTIITESNLDHFSKRECTRVKDSKLIELLNNNK